MDDFGGTSFNAKDSLVKNLYRGPRSKDSVEFKIVFERVLLSKGPLHQHEVGNAGPQHTMIYLIIKVSFYQSVVF